MIDIMQSHNSVTLTKEERLRGKAESTDPIPIRLTNNYTFHRIFKKPEVCKGFLIALLHLKETDIHSVDVADQDYQKLDMCIHVGILDFSLLTSPGFHHHIQLLNNKTSELYSDKFQIQKKLQKGKTLSETARELEDTEESLQPFYEAVQQHPDLTAEQLADLFLKEQK